LFDPLETVEKVVFTFSLSGIEGRNPLFLDDSQREYLFRFDFFDNLVSLVDK